tara:strand:+ start:401 stop:1450 length:1050 start_codon:yes stop_codon:yes gene_type:complete
MKVGTFFSGVGSPEQALNNLKVKHEIEFACDIDKYAKQTYLKNFNPKNFYNDITSLNMKEVSYVDLLVFGFPCQAFSMAGKRGGFDDTRGTLFYDALRYLKEHRPRYFIAENVKGLVNHDNGRTFRTILDCLSKTENNQFSLMPFDNLGYNIHYQVLNTKNFGIPQNRERIFIVGIRDDDDNTFRFPKEIPLKLKLKCILQNNVDSKFFLSEKNIEKLKEYNKRNKDNGNGFQAKFHNPETDIMSSLKTGGAGADDLITHSLYPRSGNPKKGGTGHLSKKDGTSYCLDTGNNQAIEKNNNLRRLTPIECERLQGFPDNFTEGVSDTQRYKQMGNTITVNVIQEIIKNLI